MTATTPTFHVGEVGVAYAPVALSAAGGVAPYRWTVSSGTLPAGLTLGGDGSVSGTPTTPGTFSFTIQAADSGDSSASIPGQIAIAAHVQATLVPACAQYCNVELGCTTACGAFGALGGGVAPYSYAVTGGTLPAGTSLSALALSGTFTGLTGWLQFTVTVTDGLGATASVSPKFYMYPHITLQGSATCYGNYVTGCTAQLAIGGGVPGSSVTVQLLAEAQNPNPNPANNNPGKCWTLATTAPPAKSSITVSGGTVNVYIPPAPEPFADGYGAIWTVQVTSSDVCGAGVNCVSNQATVTIGVQCG